MTLLVKIFYSNNMENELKSYHNKIDWVSFCMDAGFLNIVVIEQYFMAKDTAEFTQFHAVACREYTLSREEGASQPNGSKGTPRLDKYWKLLLVVCTANMELRSESCP